MNRNLGVVQSDEVVIKSRQEGGEINQPKENFVDSRLRYSVRTSSVARYQILSTFCQARARISSPTTKVQSKPQT